MKKSILVGFAILAFSTSAALATHRAHHGHAMKPKASAAATSAGGMSPVMLGGVSDADRALHVKNQHDSGVK